jgi:hypothetical protein
MLQLFQHFGVHSGRHLYGGYYIEDIVTVLLKALLDNSSANMFQHTHYATVR